MELSKEEIKYIDNFLIKKNIKYLDIRFELLDHLASEFENNSSYVLIEDYLISKVDFIKEFAKKKQKAIHWSYQKQLWCQFAKFFYVPKYVALLLSIVAVGYVLLKFFSLENFSWICFAVLILFALYPLFYQIKYAKVFKRVQSINSLISVFALPLVFVYSYSAFRDVLLSSSFWLILYCSFSVLIGVAAIIVIENSRNKVVDKYRQLVNYR